MSAESATPESPDSMPKTPQRKVAGPLQVLKAVAVPMRYAVLKELADGSYPPVITLAKKLGCHPDLMGRHLKVLQKVGLLVRVDTGEDGDGRAKHYQMPAEFRSKLPDGTRVLDFGSVVLRLSAE